MTLLRQIPVYWILSFGNKNNHNETNQAFMLDGQRLQY